MARWTNDVYVAANHRVKFITAESFFFHFAEFVCFHACMVLHSWA